MPPNVKDKCKKIFQALPQTKYEGINGIELENTIKDVVGFNRQTIIQYKKAIVYYKFLMINGIDTYVANPEF